MKLLRLNDKLELMLIGAERYALGRRSYITSTTAQYLTGLLPDLSQNTLIVFLRDLSEALTVENRCPDYAAFGDECDRVEWMRLAWAVGAELGRRSYTPLDNAERNLLTEAERVVGGRSSC